MSKELFEKMKQEIDIADWSMLEPHCHTGALICVSKGLDIIEVAVAVAKDDVNQVKRWLDEALLSRPNKGEISQWRKQPHEKIAEFIIVQPYVLMQLIAKLKT